MMVFARARGARPTRITWRHLRRALFDGEEAGARILSERLPDHLSARAWHVTSTGSANATCQPILFRTSGTTGTPSRVLRTGTQLRLEADRLSRDVLPPDAIGGIVGFAPITHLFGFVCGLCLAERRAVPFAYAPLLAGLDAVAEPRAGARTLVLSLPGSWVQLIRSRHLLSRPDHFVVLHSAGPIPERHARSITNLVRRGLDLVEIFGSNETGAIAVKRDDPTNLKAWTPLRDVSITIEQSVGRRSGRLYVSGPRCVPAHGHIVTDDIVEPASNGGFRFLGRASRIVKLNGRTLSLDVIERTLARRLPHLEVAATATRDPTRGEAFSLAVVAEATTANEQDAIEKAIRRALREELGPGIYPRAVAPVSEIARTLTGKAKR